MERLIFASNNEGKIKEVKQLLHDFPIKVESLKDEIHIQIRAKGKNYKLLISASPNYPRIHLSNVQKENPTNPPMFCMLLRKHLINGRIAGIYQLYMERVIEIAIECMNELDCLTIKKLIIEIMGKHSNIILIDGDGKILDSIKHVSREMSRIREVLPGRNYVLPPSQGKRNPLQEGAGFLKDVLFNTNEVINLQKFISKSYMGISTVTAGEIIFRAIGKLPQEAYMLTNIDKERIVKSLESFCEMILKKNYHPRIVKDFKGYPKDVLPFVYHQFADLPQTEFNMVSDALDSFYEKKDKIDRIQQKSSYLQKIVKTNLERCQKKIDIQEDVLKQASQADRFRLWGELITANIYQIPKGVKEVSLTNYYEKDGDLLIIPLDQNKTPAQNASKYFKKYTKAKKALDIVSKQLKEAQEEMKYLEGVLDDIHKCTEEIEIEEIKDEMAKEGYLRVRSRPSTKNKRSRSAKDSVPYQFISSDGFKIFVGKNNKQNDYLTLKLAQNHDIWLHTKTIPGSHVIIKTEGKQVPETTLHEAGLLAAFFSKGRNSSNVAVDYCQKKNVKKIGGAKPGMVIYNNYRTIYITPSEDEVVKLRS